MALWTDDKRVMWYGWSGYDYRSTFTCRQPVEAAIRAVTQFFLSRRGEKTQLADSNHVRFTRGKRPWSWFSISETSQSQSIDVRVSRDAEVTTVSIDYHVTHSFGLIVAPSMLAREVSELRAEMERQ